MKIIHFIFLFLGIGLLACGDGSALLPKSKFVGEIELKPTNPSKLLSENFSVRDLQFDSQDQKFKIIYDKEKKITTIINVLVDDTLFHGFAYRNKGLWYFKYQLTDSTFWLSTLKLEGDHLRGWPISWNQMYQVDTLLENMVADTLDSKFELRPTKTNIRNIYKNLFSSSEEPRYNLIEQPTKKYRERSRSLNKGKNVISKITPNFEEDYIDISMKKEGNYSYDFIKKKRRTFSTFRTSKQRFYSYRYQRL